MSLNDYSLRFLAVLLRAFPQFGDLVVEGPDAGCFAVELIAPSGSNFWVATDEDERVTVGFDAYHTHFGGWSESVDADDFENAVAYISRLMAGEYVVAVWSSAGSYVGSMSIARGETPQPLKSGGELTVAIKQWQE